MAAQNYILKPTLVDED